MKIEYRVRPVTRYVVTRWHEITDPERNAASGCDAMGEFDNAETAYAVAYALCRREHAESGEPQDSMSFIYPEPIPQQPD